MNPRKVFFTVASIMIAALALPVWLSAQQQTEDRMQKYVPHHYKLIELGTFGGPNSYFTFSNRSLNRHGVASGFADTPTALNSPFCLIDCFVTHTFLWKDGIMADLDALPESNPGSAPNDINAKGVVTGLSYNGGTTPVFGGLPLFDAVVWKDGQIIDLGTFGGLLSYGAELNDHDQVAGFALNTTPASFDLGSFCQNFPMPTQMRAFIWDRGVKRNLGTLGGTDSCALFINDRGQVAGNSFTNAIVNPGAFGVPTIHPFLWDGDEMRDLGALGSGTVATANGINNRGQVAGASNLADDLTFHAFLWDDGKLNDFGSLSGDFVEVIGLNDEGEIVGKAQLSGVLTLHAFLAKNGKMMDLGSQDGDPCSAAISINAKSQIVGYSDDCSLNNAHAFLWENGHMTDLNAFVPSSSALTLTMATTINDRGEITAEGVLPNGDQRAILLIPCDESERDSEGCQAATTKTVDENRVALTAETRRTTTQSAPTRPEAKDRVRALLSNRNRRFGGLQPK
jgi:probable HAF family extracellular repeat protein